MDVGYRQFVVPSTRQRTLQIVAVGSIFAGIVHAGLCPAHFKEAFLFGAFFATAAVVQLLWAAMVLVKPSRGLLMAGAIGQLSTAAVWLVSRTVGIPFGPAPWKPESVGLGDVFVTLVEVSVAVLALSLATGRVAARKPAKAAGKTAGRADDNAAGKTLRASMSAKLRHVLTLLPAGGALPDDVWELRHRWIVAVLWLHVPGIFIFGLARGQSVVAAAVQAGIIVAFGVLVHQLHGHRRLTTVATSVGLLTCSALLVRLSGGSIEMHFHYFVMVGVVTLYQDWWPFLIAIGYVVLQHGLAGVINPAAVYNHQSAVAHPWEWAGIHGLFVLGMSSAGIASWRLNESLLTRVVERQDELGETLSLLHATLDATADGILVVSLDRRITSFNRKFADMWSLPPDVLQTGVDADALRTVLDQLADPEAFMAKVGDLAAAPDTDSYDLVEFADGRVYERFSTPQRVGGTVVGRVWSFHDITERRRLEQELSHQAFHDSLTQLANQALFRNRVDHALVRAARQGNQVAVLFLDLDNFKTVNDSLGHTAGDQLLISVSERLRACLRVTDTAARLGGDEFAVLVEDIADESGVEITAQRMINALQQPFTPGGHEIFVSASIGIAFSPAGAVHGHTSDQLLRNGDLAMYTAKRQGKSRYEVYRPEMHAHAVDRLELEADLRRALAAGQIKVEYQPIVSLDEADHHRMVGVEALARWDHPQRGRLAPAVFIPLAEETGLIREIGRQVLQAACGQAREWQKYDPRLTVSVNVSPHQLHHEDLVTHVTEALEASGLPPETLTLEVTETGVMRDVEATLRSLTAIRAQGVRVAIDDFGTGYSSLSYLQQFPVDILKIDRAFVSEAGPQSSLASAIVSLAGALGLQAIAEGVETDGQAEALAGFGCKLAQGFHFSRPVPPAEITDLLAPKSSPAFAPA